MDYFIGILISLVVEWVKKYFGTTSIGTMTILAVISIVVGVIINFLQTGYPAGISTAVQIFTIAGAFHNLVIRRFESK